jgi:hypothetical protein
LMLVPNKMIIRFHEAGVTDSGQLRIYCELVKVHIMDTKNSLGKFLCARATLVRRDFSYFNT